MSSDVKNNIKKILIALAVLLIAALVWAGITSQKKAAKKLPPKRPQIERRNIGPRGNAPQNRIMHNTQRRPEVRNNPAAYKNSEYNNPLDYTAPARKSADKKIKEIKRLRQQSIQERNRSLQNAGM